MGKDRLPYSVLLASLGVVGSLTVFLATGLFADAKGVAEQFRVHEREALKLVAELKGKDDVMESRVMGLEKKVDDANHKLDILIDKLLK